MDIRKIEPGKKINDYTRGDLGTFSNPALDATQILLENPLSPNGFYYLKLSTWSSPLQVYCDMSGGGWMLWAQRINSGTSIDIRSTGYFAEYSAGNSHITTDWSSLNTEGHINMWPLLNGSRELKFLYNVTGRTATSPGTGTMAVSARENGNSFANVAYLGYNWATTSCGTPTSSRYDWSNPSVNNAVWSNKHSTYTAGACTGFGWQSRYYVGNYIAALDCGSCFYPGAYLFGNGGSGYYNWGNKYDYDYISFSLVFGTNGDSSTTYTTYNTNTQLWIK